MANLAKMIGLVLGIEILLMLAGIQTGVGYLMSVTDVSINGMSDFISNHLYTSILVILGLATSVGLAVGYLTKSSSLEYMMVPFVLLALAFVGDIIFISTNVFLNYSDWVGYVVLLLMAPIAVMYIVSIVSWWFGR